MDLHCSIHLFILANVYILSACYVLDIVSGAKDKKDLCFLFVYLFLIYTQVS